jgi:alpha-L-fucosidase
MQTKSVIPARRLLAAASMLLAAGNICLAQETNASPATAAAPQAGQEDRLAWFRDARFGMFVHWGPYSNLAGEWNGQQVQVGRNAEWIMHFLNIPAPEYRELARKFNPVKFDAEEWVRLAKAAGMRYLVYTAKHHDGFAMYHSKVSPYNIVDWTPFDRDPLKDLQEACARAGIRLCVYYSHSEDWDDPDAGGALFTNEPMPENYERYLENKAKPQLKELLTNYGPIGLVWFDRGIFTTEQAQGFVDLVRGTQPACLINGRVGNYEHELMGDYQNMNDNGMPAGGIEEDWETPQTLNDTWGYSRFDTEWKKPEDIIRRLVEIVSKGGNYVLNIGPRGDGSVPEESVAILEKVGEWMQKNSESIHGAKASPFASTPFGFCTVKANMLYLHVFNRPDDGTLKLPGLKNQVKKATLLTDPGTVLESSRQGSAVWINMPPVPAGAVNTVVAVELDGPPVVAPPVITEKADRPVTLDYLNAVTSGNAVKRFNRRGQFHISKWTSPADKASWQVRFLEPGRYRVRVVCAGAPGRPAGTFVFAAGGQKIEFKSPKANDWYKYATLDAGVLEIATAGEQELVLGPADEISQDVMFFRSLRLERIP